MARTKERVIPETGEVIDQVEDHPVVAAARAAHPKHKALDPAGAEVPDPVPLAPPVGYTRQPSMFEHMRQLIKSEALRVAAEQAGAETFDEANDFDVGEWDPSSPYEDEFEGLSASDLDDRISRIRDEQERRRSPTQSRGRQAAEDEDERAPPTPPPPPRKKRVSDAPIARKPPSNRRVAPAEAEED